jgi:hypothetical protein
MRGFETSSAKIQNGVRFNTFYCNLKNKTELVCDMFLFEKFLAMESVQRIGQNIQ